MRGTCAKCGRLLIHVGLGWACPGDCKPRETFPVSDDRPWKPPLGVMPRGILMQRRMQELVRAITDYSEDCVGGDPETTVLTFDNRAHCALQIRQWSGELADVANEVFEYYNRDTRGAEVGHYKELVRDESEVELRRSLSQILMEFDHHETCLYANPGEVCACWKVRVRQAMKETAIAECGEGKCATCNGNGKVDEGHYEVALITDCPECGKGASDA